MEAVADISSVTPADRPAVSAGTRMEELGRIILAYSDVTEKLQRAHAQLQQTVQSLRNELSEKNQQLQRKQRLAALGEMAAGMAHEIRNPLGGIQLYASMLAKDVQEQPAALQWVDKITAGVKRLEALVIQVLQFTREIQPHPVETDLAELVDQSIELISDRMAAAAVQCRAGGRRPMPVRVDPMLLGQAILNLLINAVEAIQGPGLIEVGWAEASGGGQLRLWIHDSGPGIAPQALERIFNPFFTTKENGTGLGLAIVHRIVEAHDGAIVVTNAPQGGAMFELRI
ncbi:MAG: ATP-binding protein [Tepidisphaeraceae bacterium]|jgi:signal transduction histidine kinase